MAEIVTNDAEAVSYILHDEMYDTAMGILEQLTDNDLIVKTVNDYLKVPRTRVTVDIEKEIMVWRKFRQWNDAFTKCKLSNGIANVHEQRRRFTLFSMFRLFQFWGTGDEVRELFTGGVCQLSVLWFATSVRTDAPPCYYEWIMDSLNESLCNWELVVGKLVDSPQHMKMMRKRKPKVVDRVVAQKIERVCVEAAHLGVPIRKIEKAFDKARMSIQNSMIRNVQDS